MEVTPWEDAALASARLSQSCRRRRGTDGAAPSARPAETERRGSTLQKMVILATILTMISRTPRWSVADAKARFSELIERVHRGERVIVFRRGRPVLPRNGASATTRRIWRPASQGGCGSSRTSYLASR